MIVSITAGLLDLYAPRFGMDELGVPGEKTTVRVVAASKDGSKRITVFGVYNIGGRHAQISSKRLVELGPEVDVVSIERYSLKDFIEDANECLMRGSLEGKPQLKWEKGKVWLVVDGTVSTAAVESMYVAAARISLFLGVRGRR